jgi:diacylglycerol kinase (ATP)
MVIVIINPASGTGHRTVEARGRARAAMAARAFVELGVPHRIEITERAGHGAEIARRAIADGASLVCGWGGDGTMNEVASVLAQSPLPLGVIPGGSGNGLARELGISLQPMRAMQQAVTGVDRWLDVGEIGGRLFVNVAGIGFDAHVARCFNEPGRRRGFLAYLATSFTQLLTYRSEAYAIALPSETIEGKALMVVVANSAQYGNGARVAPLAQPDDGRLDLVVVAPSSPLRSMWRARRLFDGKLAREKGVSFRLAETLTISSLNGSSPDGTSSFNSHGAANGKPASTNGAPANSATVNGVNGTLWFHVDGEPVQGANGSLDVRIHPRALRVRVPRA